MSEASDIQKNGSNDIEKTDIDVNYDVEDNTNVNADAAQSVMDVDDENIGHTLIDAANKQETISGEMSPTDSERSEDFKEPGNTDIKAYGSVESSLDTPVESTDLPTATPVAESNGFAQNDNSVSKSQAEDVKSATEITFEVKDDEKDTDYDDKPKGKDSIDDDEADDDDDDDEKQDMVEDEMDLDNDVNEEDEEDEEDEDIKPSKKIKKEFGAKSKEGSKSIQPEDHIEEQIAEPEPQIDEEKVKTYRQTHTIIVPSYSSWFNMKKIHPIEKKSLPEFFELNHPSKSPKVYVGYRNFMINAYRLNPNEYLTLTSCRRNLVGDVGTLMRLFKFLNKWGLINYQVNPSFKPSFNLEKLSNGSTAPLPYAGEYKVNYDSPRGLFPFETFKLNSEVNIEKLKQLMSDSLQPKVENKENFDFSKEIKLDQVTGDNKRKPEQEEVDQKITCNKKQKDDWSPTEVRKLLAGIKTYKNDWYKVSEEVKTKSPSECILKFLKLPIEDNFNGLSEDELRLMKYSSNFPVNSVDNPIISNLIFMSQLVDSNVAKAASDRASKVMYDKILEKIEKLDEVERKQEKKDEKKETEEAKNEFDDMIIEPKDEEEDAEGEENKEGDSNKKGDETGKNETEKLKTEANEALKEYDVPEATSVDHLKSLNSTTFGIVGSRAHLFKTLEEREINKLTTTILNQQSNKIELKLQKISKLEEIYQTQQKILVKQQEEVFMDRLNLTNSTIKVTKRLEDIIKKLESNNLQNESMIKELAEIKSMVYNPLSSSNLEIDPVAASASVNNENKVDSPSANPLSYQSPQTFKVWVP